MEYCINHPDKKVLSLCHNCGTYYCEKCLTEGVEYYYCNKPECQEALRKEMPESSSSVIICPNCQTEIEINQEEKSSGKIHCPECDSYIDFSSMPPIILPYNDYVELLSSVNQGDIAVIKSILDDCHIEYHVYGENFIYTGQFSQPARFFVNSEHLTEAREQLKAYDFRIFGLSKNDY